MATTITSGTLVKQFQDYPASTSIDTSALVLIQTGTTSVATNCVTWATVQQLSQLDIREIDSDTTMLATDMGFAVDASTAPLGVVTVTLFDLATYPGFEVLIYNAGSSGVLDIMGGGEDKILDPTTSTAQAGLSGIPPFQGVRLRKNLAATSGVKGWYII